MARALVAADKRITAANQKIAQLNNKVEYLQPRADYVDSYVADEDLIQIRTIAKRLGIQESVLRKALIDHDWIYREESSRWSTPQGKKVPVYRYSAMADKRMYFTPCLSHEAPRFRGEVMHHLKVTPAGAAAIARAAVRWGLVTSTELTVIEGGAA